MKALVEYCHIHRLVAERVEGSLVERKEVIRDSPEVGEQFAEPRPAASVLFPRKHRSYARKRLLPAGHAGDPLPHANRRREFLAVVLLQGRLVVKQVDMRRAAGLEQIDHPLGLGGEVQAWEGTFRGRRGAAACKDPGGAHEGRQGRGAEGGGAPAKKRAAGELSRE